MGEQKPEKTKKHICAGLLAHVRAGISMAPSDAGGLDAVQNRTLPHYTEWCIEVRPYCLTNWN